MRVKLLNFYIVSVYIILWTIYYCLVFNSKKQTKDEYIAVKR